MPDRSFVDGEAFRRRTVGKVDVGPSIIVVIENNGAVSGGLDDEFLVRVTAINVERVQAHLGGYVFEMNFTRHTFGWRLHGGFLRRCSKCEEQQDRQ